MFPLNAGKRQKKIYLYLNHKYPAPIFHQTSFHSSPNTKSQCQGENYPISNFLSGSRESKTRFVLKIPRGLQGLFKRRADGVSSPQPFLPFPSFIKTLSPHQPGVREPGSRDEPHRFGVRLESRSVKWKPNALSFLYRTVSSTHGLSSLPEKKKKFLCLPRFIT